jgi:hypothetical protein
MKKQIMDIKETFLKLTRHTYPHGCEHELFDLLPQNLEMDEFGNLYIKIGESDTMFTSHLDTATSANTPVTHVFEDNLIKTDGTSILGADDKAGVTIMLNMIENQIPGLYYFFLGEEVGCVGSRKVAEKHKVEKLPYINKVVSFDRRGTNSVISFQASQRCCSDKFAEALSAVLNKADTTFKYEKDPTGVYTDSAQFVSIYPECTNISVGYYSEHTFSERQDIEHLTKLAQAVTKVDWNSLPVERDPTKVEYDDWGYGWGSYGRSSNRYSTYDDWDYYGGSSTPAPKENKVHFHDLKYNFVSSYTTDYKTNEYVAVDIHHLRLDDEREDIYDFLKQIEIDFKSANWNGVKLIVTYDDGRTTEATRNDLIEYLSEFDLAKVVESQDKERLEKKLDEDITYKTYGYNDDYIGDW